MDDFDVSAGFDDAFDASVKPNKYLSLLTWFEVLGKNLYFYF